MIGYKGFDKNMKCQGFQYEVGKTYETNKAILCNTGFHFCEHPLDCWEYYNILNESLYAEIKAEGEITDKQEKGDSKRACTKITIVRMLTIKEMAAICLDIIPKKDTGDSSKLASSGDYSQLASSGYSSKLASSGDYSKLASSGYSSKLASSGYSSKLASSGDSSKLASSGDSSKLESSGKDSVLMSAGPNGIAKGKKGNWITLSEWKNGKPVHVKTVKIDGKKIKEDKFYQLKNKKFVEVINE
jgi:hypothetical protein